MKTDDLRTENLKARNLRTERLKDSRSFGSTAMAAPPPVAGTVRVGAGAGFAGDRLDPAVELAELGALDYLIFELLGERTVANAQQAELQTPGSGYDPTLLDRIRAVAPHCAAQGTTIVTNGGAANPVAAAEAVARLVQELGLDLPVAAVVGDAVLEQVRALDPPTWESGLPASQEEGELVSANAYLGASAIVDALAGGARIIVAGRVADPSLYVGPLAHHFGWDLADSEVIGQATVIGHLLECAGQVTGGYFADPLTKPVPGLDRLGFPYADVSADATAVISKLEGTGGQVTTHTCTEQLLYEVADPAAYITPDVVADFSGVEFVQEGADRVRVLGGSGAPAPTELKVTLGYRSGWEGEGQISYAGLRALPRAELAAEIVSSRLVRVHGLTASDLHVEQIGAGATFRGLMDPVDPVEVRLRVTGRAASRVLAEAVGREVEGLYTNGPAGGGGARQGLRSVLGVKSCSLPRGRVHARALLDFAGQEARTGPQDGTGPSGSADDSKGER